MLEKTCWNCDKEFYCDTKKSKDGIACEEWRPDYYAREELMREEPEDVCEACMIQKEGNND